MLHRTNVRGSFGPPPGSEGNGYMPPPEKGFERTCSPHLGRIPLHTTSFPGPCASSRGPFSLHIFKEREAARVI